jgi:RHS repeat-associated protein
MRPLTDAAQALAATYTYDPWGNITSSTGALATTNPWHYAGSYTDTATGYLKLGARYYNPTTGRFTQPDPAALYGGYAYAGDNPTNFTDPTGLDFWNDIAGGIAGYVFADGCVLATEGAGAVPCGLGGIAVGLDVNYSLNYIEFNQLPTFGS